jgi:hypothetical protein
MATARLHATVVALAVLAGAIVRPAPAPAQEPTAVTGVDRPTPIAAYDGRLVWSRYTGTGSYELVQRVGTGAVAKLPVEPRTVPFDVDLGPTGGGGVIAVYSRCTAEPKPALPNQEEVAYETGRGCDVYKLDLRSSREVRFTKANARNASEFWPTYWKGRLAFARAYASKPRYPYLYVKDVSSSKPSRRLPGGPRGTPATGSSPAQLELYGKRLGFRWRYRSERGTGTAYELRVDTVGGGRLRIDRRIVGLTAILIGWPGFEGGRIYWSRGCFGDPQGCAGGTSELRRGTYRSRRTYENAAGPRFLFAHERDAGITWVLQQELAGNDPQWCAAGSCVIRPLRPAYAAGGK